MNLLDTEEMVAAATMEQRLDTIQSKAQTVTNLIEDVDVDETEIRDALSAAITRYIEGRGYPSDAPLELVLAGFGVHMFLVGCYYARLRDD